MNKKQITLIDSQKIPREEYLERLRNLKHKKLIKIVTGIRRCGKSTVLEAISYVLSPTWSIPINDNDFYNGDTSAPILISATITVPDNFILESKFGTHLRSYNPTDKTIHNDMPDYYIRVITIQLEIHLSTRRKRKQL